MSLSFYLQGAVTAGLVIGLWAFAGRAVSRALASEWPPTMRALAATVIAITGIIVTAEVVGSFGQLRRVPLVAVSAIGVGVTLWTLRRFGPPSSISVGPKPPARVSWQSLGLAGGVALVAGCLVFAQWSFSAVDGFEHGIVDVDSQAQHLSHAARFAQEHSTTAIHYSAADTTVAYHPKNTELLHAVGMVAMRSDALSLALNLALLPVGLLAAFCIGRRFGSGAAPIVGFSLLATAPLLGSHFAESAGNDFAAIAFLLAAVAFFLRADESSHERVAYAFAGLAAGLALGTKLTMAAPILGLTLTVLWVMRRRLVNVAVYAGAALLAGGYWYVRNLVHVGSPVPTLKLGIFPSPPIKLVESQGASVAHYLTDKDFWLDSGPDGLTRFFGEAWPLVLVAVIAVVALLLLGYRKSESPQRPIVLGLTLTALVSLAAYLVTPSTGGDANGFPVLFVFNIRYALPGMILALVLVPAIPWLRDKQGLAALALLGLMLIGLLSRPHIQSRAAVLAVVLIVGVLLAIRVPPAVLRWGLAAVIVGGLLAGYPLTKRYERTRFAKPNSPRTEMLAFGRVVPPHSRVALVGLPLQYAFYGPRFLTRVEYVGDLRPDDEFTDYPTCTSFRKALRAGNYDFAVAQPIPVGTFLPESAAWIESLPEARKLLDNRAAQIFDLRKVTSWPSC